jgi:hypothetical protein
MPLPKRDRFGRRRKVEIGQMGEAERHWLS